MEARTAPNPQADPGGDPGHPAPAALVFGRSAILSFFIPALNDAKHDQEVVAKERPQARVIAGNGKRPFAQFYTPAKTRLWEEHVAGAALLQLRSVEVEGDSDFTLPMKDVRVILNMRFNLKKPKSYPKSVIHATKKPDLDNLVKGVLDGLVNARVLEDDNCVTDMQLMKRYASAGHPPGVEVELTCLPL